MTELDFKREVTKALEEAVFMVTAIEPNIGSTPGIPDLVISKRHRDLWLELKDISKEKQYEKTELTAAVVWGKLLRPAQRQWIQKRSQVAIQGSAPVFVVVKTPTGINVYASMRAIAKALDLDGLVDLMEDYIR